MMNRVRCKKARSCGIESGKNVRGDLIAFTDYYKKITKNMMEKGRIKKVK